MSFFPSRCSSHAITESLRHPAAQTPNDSHAADIINLNVYVAAPLPANDAHHTALYPVINVDPAIALPHSPAAVHHTTASVKNKENCNTSEHNDKADAPSDAPGGDSPSLDRVSSVEGTKKRAPARRKTSLAGRAETLGEGGNDGEGGQKRKATGNPADEKGLVDGRRSRRKVVLPSHLQEIGYMAPKKGLRAAGKNAYRGDVMA
jgi:hypothetical protein